jgi:hypothetical protein
MQKNTEYSPDTVQRLATRLHRRAVFVTVLWPVIGILAGVFTGLEIAGNVAPVVGAVIGTVVGYLIGSMRCLYYSVQAQKALCLKQIEENTRTK